MRLGYILHVGEQWMNAMGKYVSYKDHYSVFVKSILNVSETNRQTLLGSKYTKMCLPQTYFIHMIGRSYIHCQ